MKNFKLLKILPVILVILLLAFALSCLLPPVFQKKADKEKTGKEVAEKITAAADGERVLCIDDNEEALKWRLKLIDEAKESLVFTTFSFLNDESGKDIMAAMLSAADRGVKIRVIVDGMNTFADLNGSKYFNTFAKNENVEVKVYNPVNLLTPWNINYRMHDKYIVADNKLFILGGRNTKELSLGSYVEKKDVDRDVLVYSPVYNEKNSVEQVLSYFNRLWESNVTKPFKGTKKPDEAIKKDFATRFKGLKNRYKEIFELKDLTSVTWETKGITLFTNPIVNGNKEPELWTSLCFMMERGKDIEVQTPYLICNNAMYDDLTALNKDGRQIHIITNSVESGANVWGCVDYMNQKNRIKKTGATIYECKLKDSSHTKTVLIDDETSIIGSFNFDMRSTYLDTEMMLVIECPELNEHLRELNDGYRENSRVNHPDGTVTTGADYVETKPNFFKSVLYFLMRIITVPFRYLL